MLWTLKLEPPSEASGRLLKPRMLGASPRVFGSVGLGWGLVTRISNKFQGDADGLGINRLDQPFSSTCWSLLALAAKMLG